jgi:hypothetical protein
MYSWLKHRRISVIFRKNRIFKPCCVQVVETMKDGCFSATTAATIHDLHESLEWFLWNMVEAVPSTTTAFVFII